VECPYGKVGDWLKVKGMDIVIEITNIKVERLKDITEEDAKAEGCLNDVTLIYEGMGPPVDYTGRYAVERFEDLWDSIYAKRGLGWDKNSWVWVVEFKRI